MNGGERSRLAEVLAALSLATDLGAAWPPETALLVVRGADGTWPGFLGRHPLRAAA